MTTPADMPTCVGKFHKVLPLDEKLQAIPSKRRAGMGRVGTGAGGEMKIL